MYIFGTFQIEQQKEKTFKGNIIKKSLRDNYNSFLLFLRDNRKISFVFKFICFSAEKSNCDRKTRR